MATATRSRKKAAAPVVEPATHREVRAWAADNGVTVGVRGRIAASILEQFTAATGRPVVNA